jgi:broad specificity phosphatase PhoE
MLNIYLVRHGESEGNVKKVFQGWLDKPLTSKGIRQAQLLAEYFKGASISAFYSSSLSRAYETAKILAQAHNAQVTVINDMKELNCGEWQGLSRDQARKIDEKEMEHFLHMPSKLKIPGGETLTELRERALRGLKLVAESPIKGDAILVAHGVINKVLLCTLEERLLDYIWDYPQSNTAFNIIGYDGSQFTVKAKNLTPHLINKSI